MNARTLIITAGATFALVVPAGNAVAAKSPSHCPIPSKSAVISLGSGHRSFSWQTAINALDRGLHFTAIGPAIRKGCNTSPKKIAIPKLGKNQVQVPKASSPTVAANVANTLAAGSVGQNTQVGPYLAGSSFPEYMQSGFAPVDAAANTDMPQAVAPASGAQNIATPQPDAQANGSLPDYMQSGVAQVNAPLNTNAPQANAPANNAQNTDTPQAVVAPVNDAPQSGSQGY